MKKPSSRDWQQQTESLMAFINRNDIAFKQYSEYHFRLMDKIDVWPGSKKFWIIGSKGSKTYQSIKELKQYLYGTTIKTSDDSSTYTPQA